MFTKVLEDIQDQFVAQQENKLKSESLEEVNKLIINVENLVKVKDGFNRHETFMTRKILDDFKQPRKFRRMG